MWWEGPCFITCFITKKIHILLNSLQINKIGASLVAQMTERVHLPRRWPRFNPWVGKISWRRKWLPTPVFLPGEFHGQKSLAGYSQRVKRVGHHWMTNTVTFTFILLNQTHPQLFSNQSFLFQPSSAAVRHGNTSPSSFSIHWFSHTSILQTVASNVYFNFQIQFNLYFFFLLNSFLTF